MPLVAYTKSEVFPIYEICSLTAMTGFERRPHERFIELTEEELALFLKAESEFEKVQEMIHDKVTKRRSSCD